MVSTKIREISLVDTFCFCNILRASLQELWLEFNFNCYFFILILDTYTLLLGFPWEDL